MIHPPPLVQRYLRSFVLVINGICARTFCCNVKSREGKEARVTITNTFPTSISLFKRFNVTRPDIRLQRYMRSYPLLQRNKTRGQGGPGEFHQRLRQLEIEEMETMRQVLSEEDFQDYLLKESPVSRRLAARHEATRPSEEEFKQLFRIELTRERLIEAYGSREAFMQSPEAMQELRNTYLNLQGVP